MAAAVAVVGAITFGAYGFRQEVERIRRRQGSDAAQCSVLVRQARELVEQGHALDAVEHDYCRAHELVDKAVEAMRQAQSICRKALDQDPMLTSNAAIGRMLASRAELATKCSQGL